MADGEEAATEYTIGWEPQPGPQTALLACPVFEVFFGGARGGGKTDGMLGEWASHADLHGKNAVGLMVRRERVQLLETIERSRQIYVPIGARYNDQDKMWRWPNGARLRFAYLERDADADAYQGHSYTRVYVEELGTFPSASPVLRLMATLRSGEGVPCGFRATGNPGGPGHQWVKARYIDPNPAGWEIRKFTYENPWTRETIEQDRVFIPSKLRDNKFLGPEYVANLQMVGSDTLVRAWLEGDWTVIEGAYFDCYNMWWIPSRCPPIGPGSARWTGVRRSPSQWDGGQSSGTTTPLAARSFPAARWCGTGSGTAPLPRTSGSR
jgi:hypothetical protein